MKEETVILVIWSQEIVRSGKVMMITTWMQVTMIMMILKLKMAMMRMIHTCRQMLGQLL